MWHVIAGVPCHKCCCVGAQGIADYTSVALGHDSSAPQLDKSKIHITVRDFYIRELQPLPMSALQVVHLMHTMHNYRPGPSWMTPSAGRGMNLHQASALFRLATRLGAHCDIRDVYTAYFEFQTQTNYGMHRWNCGEVVWPPPAIRPRNVWHWTQTLCMLRCQQCEQDAWSG